MAPHNSSLTNSRQRPQKDRSGPCTTVSIIIVNKAPPPLQPGKQGLAACIEKHPPCPSKEDGLYTKQLTTAHKH
eukprot:1160158-Pelagomonas_calceolata.AAC.5